MKAHAHDEWIENGPSGGRLGRAWLKELWAYRELGAFFAWRELKLRYKQTVLGVAWVLLQPLLGMLLFSALFARAVDVPSDGVRYPLFAYVGLAVWAALSGGVARAGEILTEDPNLVTKVYFPRVLAPAGAILTSGLDILIALVLVGPLMAIYGVAPPLEIFLLPLCVLALLAVAFAIGVWLSALQVLYRDIRYATTFGLQAWLFAAPVLYPSSLISGDLRFLYFLNPAAGMLDGFRACILGTPLYWPGVAVSAGATVVLALTGLAYFKRVERSFADRI